MAAAVSSESNSLSFKFSKKIEKKVLLESKLSESKGEDHEETDFVLSVDDRGVKSSKPKEEKKELVIPLIRNNVWRLPQKVNSIEKPPKDAEVKKEVVPEDLTLEQQAIKEILTGASSSGRSENNIESTRNIPLLVQNKVPEGYETDEKVDVTLRADEPTMEDYDNVPIEEYGLAILRGMGWAPGKPIGARCTQVIEPTDVVLRPKGLGLGADSKARQAPALVAREEGQLVLKKGAYVCIEQGARKDMYGQVEGFDAENGRIYVRLALGGKVTTVSELLVRLVSQKEYQKEGKLLNKDKYEEYKRKHEPPAEEVSPKPTREHRSPSKKQKREKKRTPSNSGRRKEESKTSAKTREEHWLHPQIRVRFIDEKFHDGKYFNTKMVVEDLTSRTTCMCQTDDGRILEDIEASMLETVIPRKSPAHVMVLAGSYSGQVGVVLRRDKERCRATVEMLHDREVEEFEYDRISEFVGDVSQQY